MFRSLHNGFRWLAARPSVAAVLAIGLATASALPASAQDGSTVGVTSSVVRTVTGDAGGAVRQLAVGEQVFAQETIETGEQSNSQLLFRDETTLSIGPTSSVVLDRFVFNPSGQASTFSVQAARGALRFVSGSSGSNAYSVRTPIMTMGVRGTIVDLFIFRDINVVVLTEGAAEVCIDVVRGERSCYDLVKPGTYLVVRRSGVVEGPRPWDGNLRYLVGPVPYPLYGWHLDLQRGPRFIGAPERLNAVDQLESRRFQETGREVPDPNPCRCR